MKVINNPSFENHYIQVDDYNYSVYEMVKPKREGAKVTEYPNLLGHYPSMVAALKAIANNLAIESSSNDIESYIERLKLISSNFENMNLTL